MGVLAWAWVLGVAGLVMMAGTARADPQFPPRKAGLWKSTSTMSNMMMNGQKMPGMSGGMVSVSCVDAESDLKLIQRVSQGRAGCAPPVFGGGGDSFTVNVTCAVNGQTTSTAGTMTYVSAEHVVMDMRMSGTQMTGNMHIDSVWSGACPAGFAPGDYGMEMNGTFQKEGNVNNLP